MIQALRRGKKTWLLYWLEIDEPITTAQGYQIPTVLILRDSSGIPISPPEIAQELRQENAEQLIQNAIEKHGPPERLLIDSSPEWEIEAWQIFAREFKIEIRFRQLDTSNTEHFTKFLTDLLANKKNLRENLQTVATSLYENYQQLRSLRRRRTYLQKILKLDPGQTAAWVDLGDLLLADGNWKAADEAFRKATQTPHITSLTKKNNLYLSPWEDPDIQLILRSSFGSAMCAWHQGKYATAAKIFLKIRLLNPQDHQGVRFYIPILHLLDDSIEKAIAAYKDYDKLYPNDFLDPAFSFVRALTLHLQGQETEAKQHYQASILKNIYIAPLLLDENLPETRLWQPTERSEPSYAEEFIDSYSVLWERETATLRLLREAWEESQKSVKKIITQRKKILSFQDQRYDPEYKSKWKKLLDDDEKLSTYTPL
ncbi:MAG: tetratricopeptide repeat protein [Chthoniobacterales bacterium]